MGRMAALVHGAEHYGFESGRSIRTGHKKTLDPVMFDVLSVLGHAMCAAFALTLLVSGKPLAALTSAGFVPVRDGSGRQSFLRPGRQLPGRTRPFAS
ncbi:hypothetical protein [Streptomyces virginiae]|uniref:hypothetical protein n=1 Tax=Streptomyces virginiae TaxID=1961 RepID=UPI0034512F8D